MTNRGQGNAAGRSACLSMMLYSFEVVLGGMWRDVNLESREL
jgi:hypothetical protein